MTNDGHVVIVGGGHGGAAAAAALRQAGHAGPVTLLSAEPTLPYHRPPLSKAYLTHAPASDSLLLRPARFYEQAGIAVRLNTTAFAIDPVARTVLLDEGPLRYDALILATGSQARRLACPGAGLAGVHVLRDLADAMGLRATLAAGCRLAIVGAGYVGLEVAASARALGCEVVVLEREARILPRVASADLAALFHAQHVAHGVAIRTGVEVVALDGDERVAGVTLQAGERIACDAVLVGIGGVPCDALAHTAGLRCDDGVVVDAAGHTSARDVYAIGDVTRRPLPHYGDRRFRLESVPGAADQAKAVAAAIMGHPAPVPDLPWFWSDQYGLKLQIAGIAFDADRVVVRRHATRADSVSFCHLAGDRLVAVEAVNAAADFVAGKKLIVAATAVDVDRLADSSVPMKALVAAD